MAELAIPNLHALAVMVLIVAALVMFTRDDIPLETTSLVVLVLLTVGFTLFPFASEEGPLVPSEFFLGFGNRALVAVCSLMIVGQGLVTTGALEPVGRFLARVWRWGPALCLLLTLLITAVLSAFINNTPIVVMMLPILVGVAMRTGSSPTGTLIPMGFASILGGMATTIGTSTNLLVVNVAADMGMDPFGMFDFAGPVLISGVVTILYLWLVAPRLLPKRELPLNRGVSRVYTAQIRLNAGSPVVDRRLADAIERTDDSMKVDTIERGSGVFVTPLPDVQLRAGDRITTSDTQDRLREFARQIGGTLFDGDKEIDADNPLPTGGSRIAELAITPASRLNGVPIGRARLMSRYGVRLLAFNRMEGSEDRGSPGLDDVALRPGDVLLVQATPERLDQLRSGHDFLVLDGSVDLPHTRKAPLALLIMISVVALAATKTMTIEVSAVFGCLALLVTGCLRWKEAMSALSTRVIFIIVASLALGTALLRTGGADYIANLFVYITFGAPAPVVMASLMLMMALLTNVVSNNAAAVIGTPIAIGIAQRLGMPLEPFVLAVLFGSNLSFVTPMAYQTNLLIMNAAGYRFGDFVRVGLPLAIMLWLSLSGVLIWAYGL